MCIEFENDMFNFKPVDLIEYFFLSIHPYKGITHNILLFRDKDFGKAAQTSPRPPLDANGMISLLINKIFT